MMPDNKDILVFNDNAGETASLKSLFEEKGFDVIVVSSQDHLIPTLSDTDCQVAVVCVAHITETILGVLETMSDSFSALSTIVVSGDISVNRAVDVMKTGVMDFMLKPLDTTALLFKVEQLAGRTDEKKEVPSVRSTIGSIVTQNTQMLDLIRLLDQVADSSASVLIQGESGTGKELVARYIHEKSQRRTRPFVALNCAALPETLLESELFGHEKGAFTGAVSRKQGKFELADGGTILLDEITEMQPSLQSKLLRVIQEREVDRLGGGAPVRVDVRIVATTNRNIESSVADHQFREDLYYRLNVIPVNIPPLRERKDDLALLTQFFIDKFNALDGRSVKSLTKEAMATLMRHEFQGNVRELENLIHRGVLLCNGDQIDTGNLFPGSRNIATSTPLSGTDGSEIPDSMSEVPLKEVEKKVIFHTLGKTGGNRTHAAQILGISVRTLRNKLNEYKE